MLKNILTRIKRYLLHALYVIILIMILKNIEIYITLQPSCKFCISFLGSDNYIACLFKQFNCIQA